MSHLLVGKLHSSCVCDNLDDLQVGELSDRVVWKVSPSTYAQLAQTPCMDGGV